MGAPAYINYHVDAFLKNHNFYNIRLPKTLLGSTVRINDENTTIYWHSLLKTKHPNDTKRGGAGMYFKESLPLIKRIDLTTRKECSLTVVNEKNKKHFFLMSTSQNHNDLEQFYTDFDLFFPVLISSSNLLNYFIGF